jgi:hypothetical protein
LKHSGLWLIHERTSAPNRGPLTSTISGMNACGIQMDCLGNKAVLRFSVQVDPVMLNGRPNGQVDGLRYETGPPFEKYE